MLARTDSRARAVVLLLVVAVVASAIGARLVWWQVVQQAWLSAIGARPALPAGGAPGGAWRDHRRQRRAARHLDRAAVRLRHPSADRRPGADGEAPRPGPRHLVGPAARESRRRPRLGLAEAEDHARGGRAHPIARPARHRHAPRDEARLPDPGHRAGHDPGRPGPRLRRRRRRRPVRHRGRRERPAGGDARRGQRAGGRHRPPDRRLGDPAPGAGRRGRPAPDPRHRGPAPARAGDLVHLPDERRGRCHRPDHERRDRARSWRWRATRRTTPTTSPRPMASCSATPPSRASTSPDRS